MIAFGTLEVSEWINIVGIAISTVVVILIYFFGKRIDSRQKLQRQHGIQENIQKIINTDVELYNVRLYNKRFFYKNVKDVVRGYCYLGCGIRGYGIDGIECIQRFEEWECEKKVEVVGVLPYEWVQYINFEGDGSANKSIIFVKAPWFKFPYKRNVYYRINRDEIMDKYRRINKPSKQVVDDSIKRIAFRINFYIKKLSKG